MPDKLKIDFEIEQDDAIDLISQLQKVVAQTQSEALNNLLLEIQNDVNIGGQIAQRFMMWLAKYTSASISLESNLIFHLGFASWWVKSDNGLANVCNLSLKDIVSTFGGSFDKILGKDLKKVEKVKDVVKIIKDKYDAN